MTLADILRKYSPALVALSGGTDSMTLLAACVKYGVPVSAATIISEFTVPEETARAEKFCMELGVDWVPVRVSILIDEKMRYNPADRCYFCKKIIMTKLLEAADGRFVFDGTHADDLTAERPGKKALSELSIISPFALAGIGKAEIYTLAKELGVPITPPSSCLATRIPFGEEVTIEKLEKIAAVEVFLRNKGITGILRVRLGSGGAIVETEKHVMERAELYKDDLKIFGFSTIQISEYKCGGTNSWNRTEH